ncbi:MAG TPA: alkaline phosphatase D family protein [Thermoleophilaceae bacterium]|nr:alkaline phosphatase D family protein [Thermoleophilaceae bacterium]
MAVNADLVSRRGFVHGAGGLTATVLLVPEALAKPSRRPNLRGGKFAEGVASGDPTTRGITLWTRVSDVEGTGTVELQVARDRGFRKVVAKDLIKASDRNAYSVKARVNGLKPYEQYYYRFHTRNEASPIGRFRTALPADSHQPVRFAFFSCQDFTFGYFNAHALMAKEDLDFVICLGDYIYAEDYYPIGPLGGIRDDPVGNSETLDQYRAKYLTYRSDPSLRKVHAKFPMINIWDDHEVQDNYAGGVPVTGGLDPSLRFTDARKAAGHQAFFESLPTFGAKRGSGRIFRATRFGRNVDLILCDSRSYRDDQPCGDPVVGEACPELPQPRKYLGRRQMNFVKKRLASSGAAWKVVANQLMIMHTYFPGGAIINFDSWMGYPTERRELVTHIKRRKIRDVVFVTGDIHTFVAGDVRVNETDKRAVATEFVGGSVTAPGLGEGGGGVLPGADPFNPKTPEGIINALKIANPWVKGAEFDHHGYGLAVATRKDFRCTLKRVAQIKRPGSARLPTGEFKYRVRRGRPSLL